MFKLKAHFIRTVSSILNSGFASERCKKKYFKKEFMKRDIIEDALVKNII